MQRVIERILNLLAFLLTVEHPVTAAEIRNTVAGYQQESDEAFRRMFERDKELLRQLGIPVELHPTDAWGVEHGYVIPHERYVLPDPGLTDDERAALWLAAQAVRIGGQAAGADALLKLGGLPMAGGGEPLAADLGLQTAELATAYTAVSEQRPLRFEYRGSGREVHPYGLVHRRGHWYLVGPEVNDQDVVKAFRLDRASSLTVGEPAGSFRRPSRFRAADAIPEAPWEAGSDDLEATVRFDAEVAWWARRQLTSGAAVSDEPEGALQARVRVANPDAFIGWLLTFEDRAELLRPAELRERLVERVRSGA